MTLSLTAMQREAVDKIKGWYAGRRRGYRAKQEFFLAGYAGTGKTTIVEAILKELNLTPKDTVIVSTTGKASLVLNRKLARHTDIRAITIHGLLYFPRTVETLVEVSKKAAAEAEIAAKFTGVSSAGETETERRFVTEKSLEFSMKDRHKQLDGIKLIIVDEAPMMGERLYRDLLSFGIQVLFIGDTAQLPPVKSKVVLENPDYELTEVLRQKGDANMIAALAEHVRNTGTVWAPGVYGANREVQIMTRADFTANQAFKQAALMHADQVICGTNKTRQSLNQEVRGYYGFTSTVPVVGDKLICLKNNKNVRIGGLPAVNGQLGHVTEVYDTGNVYGSADDQQSVHIDFRAEGAKSDDMLEIHESAFYDMADGKRVDPYTLDDTPGYFDFGYAITCHKAQGSEWDNVLVFAEAWHADTRTAWLYTAITRASGKLILVV